MKKNIPYGKQNIDEEDIESVAEVLRSDFLTQGPKIKEFEESLCKYTGAKYCVAVSNGTAALHLAVASLAINEGEGITSAITFVASANCLIYNGLKPVLADIDAQTYNIDYKDIVKKITRKTKVIIPVHFAGRPCDMRKIYSLAKKKGIWLIEDASHAIGSSYSPKDKVGSCKYSHLTVFSFHPVKTITTGEGGAITTNSKTLYQKLLLLRTHGINKNIKNAPGPWYYEMQELGYNYRLTDMQAALGISQLKKLNYFTVRRQAIVARYNKAFSENEFIGTPVATNNELICYHLYVVKIDFEKLGKKRKQVVGELRKKGIYTQVHYIPIFRQPYYKKHYKTKVLTESDVFYRRVLSLPLYPSMTDEDVTYVINQLNEVVSK